MMRNNDLSVIINEGASSGGKGQGSRYGTYFTLYTNY